jgi:hypothetical protein
MAKYWTSPVPQFDDFGDIISDIVSNYLYHNLFTRLVVQLIKIKK